MSRRAFLALINVALVSGCLAQTPQAAARVGQLIEHWRWVDYWEGATELGINYKAGRQFEGLVFWKSDNTPPSLGFCSVDLGVCQFFPNISIYGSFSMRIKPTEDARSAFTRFIEDAFEQYQSALWNGSRRPPAPRMDEYTSELTTILIPPLEPPEAIRERKRRPQAEIEALVRNFGCSLDGKECAFHLMIPFYGEHDISVSVYSKCLKGCTDKTPTIQFFKLIEGHWWQGATNFNNDLPFVIRTRQQIAKALMVELGRYGKLY